jgi:hypothetical protein
MKCNITSGYSPISLTSQSNVVRMNSPYEGYLPQNQLIYAIIIKGTLFDRSPVRHHIQNILVSIITWSFDGDKIYMTATLYYNLINVTSVI